MSKNIYRTAQGQIVDIESLRLVNESVIAVGNMNVNARGDSVLPDGTVIETRNEKMKRKYHSSATVVKTSAEDYQGPVDGQPAPPPLVIQIPDNVVINENVNNVDEEVKAQLRGTLANSVAPAIVLDQSPESDLYAESLPRPKLKRI